MGIVMLAPEDWSARWQARHQFVLRLARMFPTVWVNPAHDRTRIAARIRAGPPSWQPAEGAPELLVHTREARLPTLHRPARAAGHLDRLRLERARRGLLRGGSCSRKGGLARRAVFLPNGVDFDDLARSGPRRSTPCSRRGGTHRLRGRSGRPWPGSTTGTCSPAAWPPTSRPWSPASPPPRRGGRASAQPPGAGSFAPRGSGRPASAGSAAAPPRGTAPARPRTAP